MAAFDEGKVLHYFDELIRVDSTTGHYEMIQQKLTEILDGLGYPYKVIRKGGVIVDAGGEGEPLCLAAHVDDIGLMVRKINADGTLRVCSVGGLHSFYAVMENVRIYTRRGKVFTGSICRTPNSVHVTEEELRKNLPEFRKDVCVVLDENVKSAADTRALGIETGDMIALDPRPQISGGYLKSRFIDDKACAAVLLALLDNLKAERISLPRKLYVYFTMYEEVGHGAVVFPEDAVDMIALDIAPTGPDQTSDERKVSIFAKDSRFPYHWGLTCELIEAAKRAGVDFAVDVFTPHYGSDCNAVVLSGRDIRHAAIGPGTANSHGYERTHILGLKNTYDLLAAYLGL